MGARYSTTSRLSDLADAAEEVGADAVVVFADDYSPEDVRASVRALPIRVTVIVTSMRSEYESLCTESPSAVILLPRPTWGWSLIEAVRTAVNAAPPHQ